MLTNFRPVLADVVLAVVLTILGVATVSGYSGGTVNWYAYVLAALMAAPIAFRQSMPVLSLAVMLGALLAFGFLAYSDIPNAGLGVLIGMFSVATLRSRRVTAIMWLVCAAVLVGVASASTVTPVLWSQVVSAMLVMSGAWMLGEATKHWGRRVERLAEEAAQAVANERVRLARELHDVVAHHMSVISLQAGVAQYVLDADPPTAHNAIATVGDTTREALKEMRRMLDVLRVDHSADSDADSTSDYAPQPGLTRLDELVERTRAAGLPVDLSISGSQRALPSGPDLCAYRVAQESLTNVLKHAGPAKARVEVEYGARLLILKVTDNGIESGTVPAGTPPTSPSASPTSHGIRGMRERAELYGGVLTAGPSEQGGFSVVLRLPMDEEL